MNSIACPLCNSSQTKEKMKAEDFLVTNQKFTIYECISCQFLYTGNAPSEAEIGKYYDSAEYISHSDTQEGFMNKLYHIARNSMLGKKYTLIKQNKANGKSILDVGSGTGYFLKFMQLKGWDVTGIEINDSARNFAIKTHALKVYAPNEFQQEVSIEKKYDVISLWHVLEHLHTFKATLHDLSNRLTQDGVLIIAVPNPDSFDAHYYKENWAALDVPRHLWHFKPAVLVEFMKTELKFNLVDKKSMPFDGFYVSMLSEKHKKSALGAIKAMVLGGWFYLKTFANKDKASSLMYVFKKNNL